MDNVVTRPRQSPDAEFNYVHVLGCVIVCSGDDGVVLDVAVTDVCIKRMLPSRGISVLWESQGYELTWNGASREHCCSICLIVCVENIHAGCPSVANLSEVFDFKTSLG